MDSDQHLIRNLNNTDNQISSTTSTSNARPTLLGASSLYSNFRPRESWVEQPPNTSALERAVASRKRRFSVLNNTPDSSASLSYHPIAPHYPPRVRPTALVHRYRTNSNISNMTSTQVPHERVVIDLTDDSPPPQPPTEQLQQSQQQQQQSYQQQITSSTVPSWQPDNEAIECFVCSSRFTFLNRRHHCRKCGRVVCASCSPHRITIPRQYIVQPPTYQYAEDSPTLQPTLWGGEEVRVCNPCVPDPNLSPPNYPFQQPGSFDFHQQYHPFITSPDTLPQHPTPNGYPPSYFTHSNAHSHSHSRSASATANPYTHHRNAYIPSYNHAIPHHPSNPRNRHSTSIPQHISSLPRRQIAEEDECPICREELPPKGPNGETTEREAHVDACISDHMYSSSAPQAATSNMPNSAPTASTGFRRGGDRAPGRIQVPSSSSGLLGISNSGPTTPGAIAASASASPSTSSPTRGRPRRMTGGRMLVYKATEKDCADGDDRTECVICLEEFEVGEEVGRLECLCKFHRKCIREWWERKGPGTCPTHQLHD